MSSSNHTGRLLSTTLLLFSRLTTKKRRSLLSTNRNLKIATIKRRLSTYQHQSNISRQLRNLSQSMWVTIHWLALLTTMMNMGQMCSTSLVPTSLTTDSKIMGWRRSLSITSLRLEEQSLRPKWWERIKVTTPPTINPYLLRLAFRKILCLLKIDQRKVTNTGKVVNTMIVTLLLMRVKKHRSLSMKSLILNTHKEIVLSRSIALVL